MFRLFVALALTLALVWAAGAAAPGNADPHRALWKLQYRRPEDVPYPKSDPYTESKAKLGKMLFFDPILSSTGTMSCASCHNPELSWTDGLPLGRGENGDLVPYRTPTLLDIAWVPELGWDGRFDGLEEMAFVPINNPHMMAGRTSNVLAALGAIEGYREAFAAAFPDGKITRAHVAMALATFERTIVAGEAPFDRWIDGDSNAISATAKRGFDIFNSKGRCAECHSGWNFTDSAFYDIGTATGKDIGRGSLFPTDPKLHYAFKVPTLRDVARSAPYMHNGSVKTLAAVIDLYDRGGIDRPSRSDLIKPLNLTDAEKSDLIAFLDTLTADAAPYPVPSLPR